MIPMSMVMPKTSHWQALRQGLKCKSFIWEVVPENTEQVVVSKAGTREKPRKFVNKPISAADFWEFLLQTS